MLLDILQNEWNLLAEASPTRSPWVTRLQTPAGRFYLKESASTESVERELDLLEYLATVALPVPRGIATAAAQRLQRLRGKVASVAALPAQLVHRDFHRGNVLFTGMLFWFADHREEIEAATGSFRSV